MRKKLRVMLGLFVILIALAYPPALWTEVGQTAGIDPPSEPVPVVVVWHGFEPIWAYSIVDSLPRAIAGHPPGKYLIRKSPTDLGQLVPKPGVAYLPRWLLPGIEPMFGAQIFLSYPLWIVQIGIAIFFAGASLFSRSETAGDEI